MGVTTRRTRAQSPCSLADSRNLVRGHFLERTLGTLAATEGALGLAVCGGVEGNEEEEVGGEDADTGDGGELFPGTLAAVGKPVPVGGGEVGPGCEVDEACRIVSWN
jgi:hypothetical protein